MTETQLNSVPSNIIAADFAHGIHRAKSPIEQTIRLLCREVRHKKITYDQLKRVFRETRSRCSLKTPGKRKSLIRLPTEEQLKTFLSSIDNPIHLLIVKTLLGTGLRISELCNVEISHIDFSKNQIFVLKGKGDKDRIVVISNLLKSSLQLFLSNRPTRYLFETERADKFSPRRLQQLFSQYSKKSGVYLHPHLCRHYYATSLARAGLSEDQRAVLCGHSKGSDAQQIYTHLSLSCVADQAIAALEKSNL